ncbi:hypothetical protein LXA43DRAFT_1103024 [Ganoderma leucocontextum]|nr:hypothetical protein LXA43DRAFT_1103024 [Ganoderma leucocontextum]
MPSQPLKGPSRVEDPRALVCKPVRAKIGDNKYPSLTSAMSLAKELGIQLMFEHICILEDLVRLQQALRALEEQDRMASHAATPLASSTTRSPTMSGGNDSSSGTNKSSSL